MSATSHQSSDKSRPAVSGTNEAGGVGVSGVSAAGRAIEGRSVKGIGLVGISKDYRGIEGHSTNEHAVLGKSTKGAGVAGISIENRGVIGRSTNEHGVFGESTKGAGVVGVSKGYRGVSGRSDTGQGVVGMSVSEAGVAGVSESGIGVTGRSTTGLAGLFEGSVAVSGDITCKGDIVLEGADYAEAFTPSCDGITAGMVVSLDEDGRIGPCRVEYDRKVAGVVSGGLGIRPGIVLDRHVGGVPVALMGKVWALADATRSPIEVGDLLTTSEKPGHAQTATDGSRALGAVIGKALTGLPAGYGLVRVLVIAS